MTEKFDFGGLQKELDKYQILPKRNGPYTFEAADDGLVYIKDKRGNVRGHMPKDVYEDILKMEQKRT